MTDAVAGAPTHARLHYALAEVRDVYYASNADATKALYARLNALGLAGELASNLMRACKTSERAKVYRGRSHRGASYDRKAWSVENACRLLGQDAAACGVSAWGWKRDPDPPPGFEWVIYIEIPTGQVSYHAPTRGDGPDYPGEWDGQHSSAGRVITWAARLLAAAHEAEAAE